MNLSDLHTRGFLMMYQIDAAWQFIENKVLFVCDANVDVLVDNSCAIN